MCVRVGKIAKCHSRHGCRRKDPAPRCMDLQVSQVTCTWFGLNKMYADMYVSVCSGHTGCKKVLHGMISSRQVFILMDR